MRCRLAITNLTKFPFKKVTTKGSKMAQKVKLLATKLNDPSSVPKIYMLEGKNRYYDPPLFFLSLRCDLHKQLPSNLDTVAF